MADTTPSPESPEGLRRSLRDLIEESRALRSDVKADAARRRKESLVTMGVATLFVLLIGVVLAVAWQNGKIGEQNREISRQIADCTTAGGECYERGRERTGSAIAELVRANLVIEQCARRPGVDTDAELEACVARKLADG